MNVLMGDRFDDLLADYNDLHGERDRVNAELLRRFPRGFDGNGCPGDYESLEMDYADDDRDFRDWLASDDGQEFKRLRANRAQGGAA